MSVILLLKLPILIQEVIVIFCSLSKPKYVENPEIALLCTRCPLEHESESGNMENFT